VDLHACVHGDRSHGALASPAGFANRLHMAMVNMLSAEMRSTRTRLLVVNNELLN
jgi:hypothetical protein